MTRSVVTDPTTALDHAGRDVQHRDPLTARLAAITGSFLVLAAVGAVAVYNVVSAWLGGTS